MNNNIEIETMGTYTPFIKKIAIQWKGDSWQDFFFHYFHMLLIEGVLYHEIGHHVHRHTFGYNHDQEREANAYSRNFFLKTHPIIRTIGDAIRLIVKLIQKAKKSPHIEVY